MLRKSACSGVSTPSARVRTPIFLPIEITDEMIARDLGVSLRRNAMSSFRTSKSYSLRRLSEL